MRIREEIDLAIKDVLDSGQFILGKNVKEFEKELAEYLKVKYCVGVANGTEALFLSLRALGIGHNHQVITVSHTAPATTVGIVMSGATPVYIDVKDDYLMDDNCISSMVTHNTKAILPVNLYGRQCDMKRIKKIADSFGLYVIEDCCQSIGAGDLYGDVGCYSFYPTKNLGGIGDGGCIVTNSEHIYNKVKRMRDYSYGERFVCNFFGINSRLDEIQAAVLRIKLKYLSFELERRLELAKMYYNELNCPNIKVPDLKGTFHQFVIRVNASLRDSIASAIEAQVHYPMPCHLQPAFNSFPRGKLFVTEQISKEILSMPMRVTLERGNEICKVVKNFL